MKDLGYYNGHFGPLDEMTVPMNDRVCYFGDGIYEASICENYIIYALDEHVDRLFNNAGFLEIEMPVSKEELKHILQEMVNKLDSHSQTVYWQVTRGTASRAHVFPEQVPANLWITLRPSKLGNIYDLKKLITLEDTRFLHCNLKTLNLLPAVMASQKAKQAGCYEAVLHRQDRVTECSHSNVLILKNGILKTAPTDNLILPGIIRKHVIEAAIALGIPVEESAFSISDLMQADEVLVTSSTVLCLVADEINKTAVGRKDPKTAKALQDAVLDRYYKVTSPHSRTTASK